MTKLASDIWIGLRTVPARAGLVLFSLFIGIFAATVLISAQEALRRQARELVEDFGADSFALVRSASPGGIPWERERVAFFRASLGDAALVSGLQQFVAPRGVDIAVVAVDAELARVRGWRFAAGRGLDAADIRQGARHAVASEALCQQVGWRVGELILIGQESFRLVGRLESEGLAWPLATGPAILIPYSLDAVDTGPTPARYQVGAIWFRAAGGTDIERLHQRVAGLLNQPGMGSQDVEWVTPESLLRGIRRWQRMVTWTAGSGSALGLLLGAVTLAGMLLTGVRERIPEIGLRRALGARRRDIAGLFVVEALVLTIAAALAGIGAAEVTLNGLGERFPLPANFGWETRLLPLVLAVVLALLCSIGPAIFAARLPPAEALRNE